MKGGSDSDSGSGSSSGSGSGGGGGRQLVAKAASNKSINDHMQCVMTKVDSRKQRNNQPMMGESKAGIGGGGDGDSNGSSGGGGGR